jgi:hypothetical protein
MLAFAMVVSAGALFPELGQAGQREWNFTATLDGKPIGYHRFRVSENGASAEVESEARFDVKILFVSAYRYSHSALERWSGGCLQEMVSSTDDNGRYFVVNGRMRPNGFALATGPESALGECISSFAYWDPSFLQRTRLLNAQNGEYLPVKVSAPVSDSIRVRGQAVAAKRYLLEARELRIELWYSPDGEWLALESIAAGGRLLRYSLER